MENIHYYMLYDIMYYNIQQESMSLGAYCHHKKQFR